MAFPGLIGDGDLPLDRNTNEDAATSCAQTHVFLAQRKDNVTKTNCTSGPVASEQAGGQRPRIRVTRRNTRFSSLTRSPWPRSMPWRIRPSRSRSLQRSSRRFSHLAPPYASFPRTDGGPTSASGCSASGVDKNGKLGPLVSTHRNLSTAPFDSIGKFRAILAILGRADPTYSHDALHRWRQAGAALPKISS